MHVCAVTRPHFSNLDHEDTDSDESEEEDDEPVRTLYAFEIYVNL